MRDAKREDVRMNMKRANATQAQFFSLAEPNLDLLGAHVALWNGLPDIRRKDRWFDPVGMLWIFRFYPSAPQDRTCSSPTS